ncbi:MAG: hypothetical protein V3V99_04755 [candidate division Zixibacteria bacterium]
MEISRNVILDLLPLYFANELSEESRKLVEKYLEADPQLAKLVKQSAASALSQKTPVPLTQNDELIAYRRAKQGIMWRTIVIAIVIAAFLALILMMFFSSSSSSFLSSSTPKNVASSTASPADTFEELRHCCAIDRSLCETADSRTVEHEPNALNVCMQIIRQEDGYISNNCMTRNTLTEGMKNV